MNFYMLFSRRGRATWSSDDHYNIYNRFCDLLKLGSNSAQPKRNRKVGESKWMYLSLAKAHSATTDI